MGNLLAATVPSQIFTVESYLADANNLTFDKSLGSTRFMKVARAKFQEGYTVVKVFVIPEQSIDLDSYKSDVEKIKDKLKQASNCIPFQQTIITDRAALLIRQYAKHNLYDRISTRPFYNDIEKRWIAFQLLCALNQIAKLEIFHGDIKSENVLVTSWNWLLLTDFASYKPMYLPNDNPADFNYFFDTSRRRTCYIAPERFSDPQSSVNSSKNRNAEQAMDMFSAGCVIAELFTEGSALFDLPQLLLYRENKFYPDACLAKIDDLEIRNLVKHMIQLNPADRFSAEQYLTLWKGRAFPEHFYSFLKFYLGKFSEPPLMSPDQMVTLLHSDINKILNSLVYKEGADALVLIASLLLSCVRKLKYVNCKLKALQLIVEYSKHLGSEVILERFVPYLIEMVHDPVSRVKAHALHALATCLTFVNQVPRGEANIFTEYILPGIDSCANDPSVPVRQAFAENIAVFAEAALSFLDGSQGVHPSSGGGEQVSYDAMLQPLVAKIHSKVQSLMSYPDPNVRQSLLEFSVARLCVFFGRQKANDVLLTHMITFLNDKQNWQLRASFFTSLVRIATYIGWQSSHILKTLLQQGLSDSQEFVVAQALTALACLVELGLLEKKFVCELMRDNISFLVHPCQWIRLKMVSFLCACATSFDLIDTHCYVLPVLVPYLKYNVLQIEKQRLVLNALRPHVKYSIYDLVYNAADSQAVFNGLKKRQKERNVTDKESLAFEGDNSVSMKMSTTLKKLLLKEMSTNDEEMLLHFEPFILRQQRNFIPSSSTSSADWQSEDIPDEGIVHVSSLGEMFVRRHADLVTDGDVGGKGTQKNLHKQKKRNLQSGQAHDMNEDWKTMFGTDGSKTHSTSTSGLKKTNPNMSITMSQLENATKQPNLPTGPEIKQVFRCSTCKRELKDLVHHRRDLYKMDVAQRELEEQADNNSLVTNTDWQPRGYLVAHMREHRGPIHRVAVSPSNSHFVTVSSDRSVRLWEGAKLEGKAVVNRSKAACQAFASAVKCVAFCDDDRMVCAADDGKICSISVDIMGTKPAEKPESMPVPSTPILFSHTLDTVVHGRITDLKSVVNSQVVAFTTSHGSIMALDMRSNKYAWKLKHNLSHGLPNTFCLDPRQHWLCLGTAHGTHVCWDLRFQLPITDFTHPSHAGVRRLTSHPTQPSCVVSVVTGNNEISVWDLETGTRQMTLWASTVPILSELKKSADSVNGLCTTISSTGIRMYTGGTDGKIRLWDINNVENSKIICGPEVGSSRSHYTATYQTRLVDGTHVIQEQIVKTKTLAGDDASPSATDPSEDLTAATKPKSRLFEHVVPLYHHDVITDVAMFHVNQTFLVSTARDGIVKVWK